MSESPDKTAVCAVDDVPQHMPLRVEFKGRGVLICHGDDGYFAVDEICPHKNRSMRRGVIFQNELICPHHQYHFDLETGRCNRRCAPVQTYDLQVDGDTIYLCD